MIPTLMLGGLGRTGSTESDPYTVFLSHFDGTDASTTLLDVKGNTMTAVGNAQLDTAQAKFGPSSGLFDGNGDFWSTPDKADWYFAAGDFTVECWVRVPSITSANPRTIVSHFTNTGNQRSWRMQLSTAGILTMNYSTTGSNDAGTASAASAVAANTWHHVAIVRNGTSMVAYLDGVGGTSLNVSTNSFFDSNTVLRIGAMESGGAGIQYMDGWIDEMRISKGIARYTANFTPPSAPFDA